MMLSAFTRLIQARKDSPDAVDAEDGNIILIKGSDVHYTIEPATFEAARRLTTRFQIA